MPKIQTSLRLEEETFNEAKKILASLGMNFTEAVNIFTSMVVQERGLPFDVKVSDYPPISFEEAQEKVRKSFDAVHETSGKPADVFFEELLSR